MSGNQRKSHLPSPPLYFHSTLRNAEFFQDRPELKELCTWWRQRNGGICALVGMGGAGKSAVTSALLSMLPEVMEDSPTFPKDLTLPKPTALFVFSFSDNPDPAYFFNALVAWLDAERDPSATRV